MPLDVRVQFPAKYRRLTFRTEARERIEHTLGHWGAVIRRVDVRFADVNGPKGGIDTRCTILVSLTGAHEHVVHSDGTAPAHAFALALPRIERAVKRDLERRKVSTGRPKQRAAAPPAAPIATSASLIGRTEGRSKTALAMTLARPEKQVRNLFTDTAQPGISETDRRAGGGHSARRNTRAPSTKSTVTLEDSLGRPSRKSTRKSANRGKASQGKERTAAAAVASPRARAQRGKRS